MLGRVERAPEFLAYDTWMRPEICPPEISLSYQTAQSACSPSWTRAALPLVIFRVTPRDLCVKVLNNASIWECGAEEVGAVDADSLCSCIRCTGQMAILPEQSLQPLQTSIPSPSLGCGAPVNRALPPEGKDAIPSLLAVTLGQRLNPTSLCLII